MRQRSLFVVDFFRVNSKISQDIKTPFKLDGITRVDDTPVHKAVREALVNCLVNADFYLPRGIVIKKNVTDASWWRFRSAKQESDENVNLLGIGERARGGIPDIYQVWVDQEWNSPVVEEFYNPDRTRLSLDFRPKQAKKNGG